MPYVNEIEASQADAHLSEIYRKIEQKFGFLPHYFMALGAKPDVIEGQSKLNVAIMQDGALTEAFKEQIGVVVSGINASSSCAASAWKSRWHGSWPRIMGTRRWRRKPGRSSVLPTN
jgi:alkylhydroperoxidase family enzyme